MIRRPLRYHGRAGARPASLHRLLDPGALARVGSAVNCPPQVVYADARQRGNRPV